MLNFALMSDDIKVNGLLFTWLKLNAFLNLQILYNKYLLWRSLGKKQSGYICQLEIFQGDQNWGSIFYLVRSVRGRLSNRTAWRQYKPSTGLHIYYQWTFVVLSHISAWCKGSFMWWCPKAENMQSFQQQYDFYCQETSVVIWVS